RRFGLSAGLLERAGLGRVLRRGGLHRVADLHKGPFGAGHRALDHDQAALDVDAHDLQVHGGDRLVAEVAAHLLALEGPARILALTGGAQRAVRHRHAVGRTQTAEVPALHAAGEALTDGDTLDVDLLAGDEVVGGQFRPHFDHVFRADPELGHHALGL